MKKSLIAVALLSTFAGTALAQGSGLSWDALESKDDWNHTNGTTFPSGGILVQDKAVLAEGETLFLNATDEGSDGYGSQNGFSPTSSNATNNGIIYVKGNDTQNTSVIGMSAGYIQGFTATNNGEIWVDGGTSAQSSAIAVTPDNKAVNTGYIYVKNGYGILHLPEEYDDSPTKTVAIENSGTINVEGEGSYAIYTNAQQASEVGTFEGATQQVLVTNSGTIEATSGASAIKATGKDVHVTLEGQSKVVGAVELGENTDLTIDLAEDNNNTQLELVGEKIRNVTLKDSTLEFTGNQSTYEFASLSTTGDSQIRLIGNDRTLKVNDLNGSVSLYSDHVSEGSTPVFAVDGIGADDQLNVTFGGNTADNIGDTSDLINVFNSSVAATDGTGNNAAYTGVIAETVTTGEMTYTRDENGNVTTSMKTATVAESTKEMAALNAMSWRSELSTLTDRMGSIRTQPKNVGSWIRYTGEELEKDDVTATLKMNTVELGVDMPIGQTAWTVGASFSYGDGDGDFDAGSTDNKKYTLGLYATYINEYGCFLDIMGKVGKVQSDFEFATTSGVVDTGDVDQTGYIFGVEAGKRFTGQTFFAEPSVGLIYSRLDSDSAKTQNRAVKLDAVDSLIARAGTLFGGQFADGRANLYGKAFILHDFQGDVEGQAKALSQGAKWRSFEQELAGTWGEFGVGGTYDFTESSKFYFDISKTVGGDVDSNYRVNVGAKYTF